MARRRRFARKAPRRRSSGAITKARHDVAVARKSASKARAEGKRKAVAIGAAGLAGGVTGFVVAERMAIEGQVVWEDTDARLAYGIGLGVGGVLMYRRTKGWFQVASAGVAAAGGGMLISMLLDEMDEGEGYGNVGPRPNVGDLLTMGDEAGCGELGCAETDDQGFGELVPRKIQDYADDQFVTEPEPSEV